MSTLYAKFLEWLKNMRAKREMCILICAVFALCIGLCISIIMRVNIQKEYTFLTDNMLYKSYASMLNMHQLFDKIEEPEVDVRNRLLPEMKAQYSVVKAMSETLLSAGHEAVLTLAQIDALDTAFADYYAAYKSGAATGLAKANMATCLDETRPAVTTFFEPKDKKEEVPLVDSASGKFVTNDESELAGT